MLICNTIIVKSSLWLWLWHNEHHVILSVWKLQQPEISIPTVLQQQQRVLPKKLDLQLPSKHYNHNDHNDNATSLLNRAVCRPVWSSLQQLQSWPACSRWSDNLDGRGERRGNVGPRRHLPLAGQPLPQEGVGGGLLHVRGHHPHPQRPRLGGPLLQREVGRQRLVRPSRRQLHPEGGPQWTDISG